MMGTANRRVALAGFALQAFVSGEGRAAPAVSEPLDRELFEQLSEWRACATECDRLYGLLTAAQDRFDEIEPPLPDAIRARPGEDHNLGLWPYTGCYGEGGRWFCYGQVEKLRSVPRRRVVVSKPVPEDELPADAVEVHRARPWPEAQARADEIVAAWDRWRAELARASDDCGLTEARVAYDRETDRNRELRRIIVTTPALCIEGILAKAAVCGWCWGGTRDAADELAHDLERTGPTAEALVSAIALDLMRLIGVPEDERCLVQTDVSAMVA